LSKTKSRYAGKNIFRALLLIILLNGISNSQDWEVYNTSNSDLSDNFACCIAIDGNGKAIYNNHKNVT
jgi:hypothetical protein